MHRMANDALTPSKRHKRDPAELELHRAADADVQERGVFQEPEAHPADVRHSLAQEEMRLLQAELSQARAACANKDSEILYLQNSQEEMRLLQAELSQARGACANKDSEILYLQNLVVRLQPLVVPCRMLAAAFPPPPVDNGGDDDGGDDDGMRLLRLAVFSLPPDHSRNDAVALFDEAMLLCADGRYRCAVSKLKRAVALGHVAAHAELAWLIDVRREGVQPCSNCVPNCVRRLCKLGSDLGCPHSKGVWALLCFYNINYGNNRGRVAPVRGLQLARESAAAGSKYVDALHSLHFCNIQTRFGQYVLGRLYTHGARGLQQDVAQAVVYLQLAAEQGLEAAQHYLGDLYSIGRGVAQDHAAAAVWYRRAAQQGYGLSCMSLAQCYSSGEGVERDRFQAIFWHKRAYLAGIEIHSERHLNDLGVRTEELMAIKVRYNPLFHTGCGLTSA